jgi:hypothetical protein
MGPNPQSPIPNPQSQLIINNIIKIKLIIMKIFYSCKSFSNPFILFMTIFLYFDTLNSKPVLKVTHINSHKGFRASHHGIFNDILEEFYDVEYVKPDDNNYDLIFDNVFGNKTIDNKNSIKIFFTGESYDPRIGQYDLSLAFNYTEHPKYMRLPLYYLYFPDKLNTEYDRGKCDPQSKKAFGCFLFSDGKEYLDGVKERNRVFHLLSQYKTIRSGGKLFNNIGRVIPKSETGIFLSNCKFIISIENKSYNGYITEKLFQAYFAGAIPIYYADDSVLADFNKKAIIWTKDYSSDYEFLDYIKQLDTDDKLYCDKWNEKILIDPERNADKIKEKLRKKFKEILNK